MVVVVAVVVVVLWTGVVPAGVVLTSARKGRAEGRADRARKADSRSRLNRGGAGRRDNRTYERADNYIVIGIVVVRLLLLR